MYVRLCVSVCTRRPDEEMGLQDYPVLRQIFERFGEIVSIKPQIVQGTRQSWCFVSYTDADAVQYALRVAMESPDLLRLPKLNQKTDGPLLKVKTAEEALQQERKKQGEQQQGTIASVFKTVLGANDFMISSFGFGGEDVVMSGYSQLLQAACDYAQDSGSPIVFESPVLQTIIAHKWNEKRWMYFTQFSAFIVYLFGFGAIALYFDDWSRHENETVRKFSWALWFYISFMTFLRTKYELTQFHHEHRAVQGTTCHIRLWRALGSYLSDKWNWVDVISCGASAVALAAVAVGEAATLTLSSGLVHDAPQLTSHIRTDATSNGVNDTTGAEGVTGLHEGVDPILIKNFMALAVLGCGFKLLYYLRGIETTAFLINMLDSIISDKSVIVFMLVLLVLLLTFAAAYYILLGNPAYKGTEDENGFETYFRSFLTTFYMALGEVDAAVFFPSSTKKTKGFAAPFLLFFAFIITIVMLNALIAIMSDTYRSVQEVQMAAGLLERTMIILEMVGHLLASIGCLFFILTQARGLVVQESMMVYERPDQSLLLNKLPKWMRGELWAPIVMVILTLQVRLHIIVNAHIKMYVNISHAWVLNSRYRFLSRRTTHFYTSLHRRKARAIGVGCRRIPHSK